MKIIDRLLRLRERQMINDNVKSVLYFKRDRFFDLFSEIQMMSHPAFDASQVVWDIWLEKIMPIFVRDGSLRVLEYEIRVLLR